MLLRYQLLPQFPDMYDDTYAPCSAVVEALRRGRAEAEDPLTETAFTRLVLEGCGASLIVCPETPDGHRLGCYEVANPGRCSGNAGRLWRCWDREYVRHVLVAAPLWNEARNIPSEKTARGAGPRPAGLSPLPG